MLILLAALLAGQAAPATQPPVVVTGKQVKQKKPKSVCQMIEVTGSRFKQRVCQDQSGYAAPLPGVSDMVGAQLKTTHENGTSGQPMASVPTG